ncbi:ABC transporter permease [Ectobacillus funiculus]|uniref:ABC transporter permease n=1 Tax=Ectobacillus funiculus TaxID=137993 RepID=UPI00101B9ADE|nr:ABC transporter permease [Ectobacillus funiculus]
MNILSIAINEIKRDFRDVRTLIFMLAFPIVLMLVLGTALSNAFNTKTSIPDIQVLYKDTTTDALSQYFEAFAKEVSKSGIHFKKISNHTDGKEEVKQNHYDGYVEINNDGIKLYESDRSGIENNIMEGMLTSFVSKYNVATEVAKVDPEQVSTVIASGQHDDYIKETSLHSAKQPSAMDYYAITMTTMIVLYGAMGASYLIRGERIRGTADRLVASPIRKGEIFLGKILGSTVRNSLCVLAVILFSKFVFKVNWGNHLGFMFLVLLTEVLLAISFGLGISYIAKTGEASRTIVMVVVQFASFFGGAYFKIENTGEGILHIITKLSPLTWENAAITKMIYANDVSAVMPAVLVNIGVAGIFLLIAIISFQRREGL